MDEITAKQELRILMDKHGLLDWDIALNNRKRGLGLASGKKHRIELSRYMLRFAQDETIYDTMLHEIAHAIDYKERGQFRHDWHWKRIALRIGARPDRLADDNIYHENIKQMSRYSLVCDKCGRVSPMHRKIKRSYRCGRCYTPMRFVENY